jgi:hypothetical protein
MKTKYDWLRFWMHFAFGIVLGLVVSFAVFGSWFDLSSIARLALIAGITLTVAILGGLYGDLFWTRLLESRFFRFLAYWSWP